MQQHIARFLTHLAARNASPHTLAAYRSDVLLFADWLREQDPPVESVEGVTSRHVLSWTLSLRDAGRASSTIARRYAAVRSWLAWLAAHRVIPDALDLPHRVSRDPRKLPHVPSAESIASMISNCDASTYCGARDRAVLEFLYSTGCRAAQVGPIHPHTLRHAFATHLLEHGAPLLAIRELLGHASITSTQLYTQLAPESALRAHRKCHPRWNSEK